MDVLKNQTLRNLFLVPYNCPIFLVNLGVMMYYEGAEFVSRKIKLEREMNYEVYNKSCYLCRLVPRFWGFELSILDKAFDVAVPEPLVYAIGCYIISNDE